VDLVGLTLFAYARTLRQDVIGVFVADIRVSRLGGYAAVLSLRAAELQGKNI